MRLLAILGTRPEAIKLFPVVRAARREAGWQVQVCATGQHRHMLDQVLGLAGIVPDFDLDIMRPGQTPSEVAAAVLAGLGGVFAQAQPDLVLVQGDTTTAMAAALAAFYRRVPVGHVEAGLRSGDLAQPWPEEANRKLISVLAALHFAPTDAAAEHLRREGAAPASVHVTGNTVVDALHWIRARLERDPAAVDAALPPPIAGRRTILVTTHRRESFDGGIERTCHALARLAERPDVEIVFPVHLNPQVREPVGRILAGKPRVHLVEPLEYLPFVRLMSRAALIVTDSGGIQEEAPSFGVPVLVTRAKTERPEAVAAGSAMLVGTDPERIVSEATRLLDDAAAYRKMAHRHDRFGDGQAAPRIVEIIGRWRP